VKISSAISERSRIKGEHDLSFDLRSCNPSDWLTGYILIWSLQFKAIFSRLIKILRMDDSSMIK